MNAGRFLLGPRQEVVELVPHDFVVVGAGGIAGNSAVQLPGVFMVNAAWKVIQTDHDHATDLRQHRPGVLAGLVVAAHVGHFTREASGQPILQVRETVSNRGRRNTDQVEAQLAGMLQEALFKRRGGHAAHPARSSGLVEKSGSVGETVDNRLPCG